MNNIMSLGCHQNMSPSAPSSSPSTVTTPHPRGAASSLEDGGDGHSNGRLWGEDRLGQFVETLLIEVYRCSVCKACFTQRSAVRGHMELHHSDLFWRCPPPSTGDLAVTKAMSSGDLSGSWPTPTPSAALSSALEVLVGMGTPLLTPERSGNRERPRNVQQSCETTGDGTNRDPLAVYNLSEVSIDSDSKVGVNLPEGFTLKLGSKLFVPDSATRGKNSELRGMDKGGTNLECLGVSDPRTGRNSPIAESDEMSVRVEDREEVCRILDDGDIENDHTVPLGDPACVDKSSLKAGGVTIDRKSYVPPMVAPDAVGDITVLLDMSEIEGKGVAASRDRSVGDVQNSLSVSSGDSGQPVAITLAPSEGLVGQDEHESSSDINHLLHTASRDHPYASVFVVVSQSEGDGSSEMLEFRRSRKSDAIIPTTKSLGIVSPFPRQQRTSKKRFSCQTCPARYASEEELARHRAKKHLRSEQFLCDICGLALASKGVLQSHVLALHSESGRVHRCGECDYWTRHERHFRNHLTGHSRGIWCGACEQSFTTPARLEAHRRSALHRNRVSPLTCGICEYTTYKQDNLRLHMRKHADQRPYRCTQCEYASSHASTLKKHVMAKHAKIRPHQCSQCEFSSVDRRGLTIHLRKHSGEKPFKCSLCEFAAKRRATLTSHLRTHKETAGLPTSVEQEGPVIEVLTDLPP